MLIYDFTPLTPNPVSAGSNGFCPSFSMYCLLVEELFELRDGAPVDSGGMLSLPRCVLISWD